MAPLPEGIYDVRLGLLGDGRVLLASLERANAVSRLSLYISDSSVSAWQRVTRIERPGAEARVSVTPSGVIFGTRQPGRLDITRYDVSLDRWQSLASLADRKAALAFRGTWNEAVFVSQEVGPSTTVLRELRDGALRPIPSFTPASDVRFSELPSAEGTRFAAVGIGTREILWTRPGAPATLLPALPPQAAMVPLDEYHLLSSDGLGTWLITLDQTSARSGACAGLDRVLLSLEDASASHPSTDNYRAFIDLVDPTCKLEYQQGQAPALAKRLHEWSSSSSLRQRAPARILACALHDPAALENLHSWLHDERSLAARAACFDRLLEWPEAVSTRQRALAYAVRETGKTHVDPAVLFVSSHDDSPIVLDRLTPVLNAAAEKHAAGFDQLYVNLCRDRSGAAAPQRTSACEALHNEHEATWSGHSKGIITSIVATTLVAGAVTTAYFTRHSEGSRAIATSSGMLGGVLIGGAIAAAVQGGQARSRDSSAAVTWTGVLAGGIGGGVAAYFASRAPSARAPTTGVGLVLPYIVTVAIAFQ